MPISQGTGKRYSKEGIISSTKPISHCQSKLGRRTVMD